MQRGRGRALLSLSVPDMQGVVEGGDRGGQTCSPLLPGRCRGRSGTRRVRQCRWPRAHLIWCSQAASEFTSRSPAPGGGVLCVHGSPGLGADQVGR